MTIGSKDHARFILRWYRKTCSPWGGIGQDIPKGWTILGSGSFRYAFLHIESKVVYKVDMKAGGRNKDYDSKLEVKNATKLRKGNDGYVGSYVRIPETVGFVFRTVRNKKTFKDVVVAMEYVEPTPGASLPDEAYWELYKVGFKDMHAYNYLISNGYLVPIDMASKIVKKNSDLRVLSGTCYYDKECERQWG